MKNLLTLNLLMGALIAAGCAVGARAQQHDKGALFNSAGQQLELAQSTQQQEPQPSLPKDELTQDPLTFGGSIVKEKERVLLDDPVTKMIYQFDDQRKAIPYLGMSVKVTGKLDLNSNTIYIVSIEPVLQ